MKSCNIWIWDLRTPLWKQAGQSQVQSSPGTEESQDISQTFQEDLQAGEISGDFTVGVTILVLLHQLLLHNINNKLNAPKAF